MSWFLVRDLRNPSVPGKIIARYALKATATDHAARLNEPYVRRGEPIRYHVTW
jgi:hypothetical protein